MNIKKLKTKSPLGTRFTRQEKLIIHLFGPSSDSTTHKTLPRRSSSTSSKKPLPSSLSSTQKSSSSTILLLTSRNNSSTCSSSPDSRSISSIATTTYQEKPTSINKSTSSRTPSPIIFASSPEASWIIKTPSPRTPSSQYFEAPSPESAKELKITWKLIPLDLPPVKFTRPPLHYLHQWDRRARRDLSPRFEEREKENIISCKRLNSKERRRERRKNLFNKV